MFCIHWEQKREKQSHVGRERETHTPLPQLRKSSAQAQQAQLSHTLHCWMNSTPAAATGCHPPKCVNITVQKHVLSIQTLAQEPWAHHRGITKNTKTTGPITSIHTSAHDMTFIIFYNYHNWKKGNVSSSQTKNKHDEVKGQHCGHTLYKLLTKYQTIMFLINEWHWLVAITPHWLHQLLRVIVDNYIINY
jgi:hypothetical protein